MDNQNTQPQQVPQQPIVPPEPTPRSHILPMVLIGLIMLGIGLGGGYFLFANKSQQTPELPTQQVTQKTPAETLVSTPALTASVPSDWTIKNSAVCNVEIPLPPKKEPYYIPENLSNTSSVGDEGGYWQYEEYKAGMFLFNTTARVIFRHPEAASGYTSGNVEVICSPNIANDTTASLMQKVKSEIDKNSQATDGGDNLSIKEQKKMTMWGRDVEVVTFQGGVSSGEYNYIFATPKNIYLVRKIAMSDNSVIKESAEQILNNLKFND